MSDPVDELEFLSRSKHRIHILRALREPCDRSTLRDRTSSSKSTVSRALGEFESRDWVRHDNHRYQLTPLGAVVAAGVDTALKGLETAENLAPIAEFLPVDAFGFGLDNLHDATVSTESFEVFSRLGSLLYEAEHVRILTGTVASNGIELHRRAIADHGQTLEVIITADALETVRSTPALARLSAPILETDGVSVFRYDGTVPYFLALTGGRVLIGVFDDSGVIHGLVESDDPTVREWATNRWADYSTASDEVTLASYQ